VVRPASVFFSLLGTQLGWRDRALIGSIDPRGVVAASTAAAFTGSLAAAGLESDFLLPVVFGVILGTGIIYGLGAKPMATVLGLVRPVPQGVAIIGHRDWVVDLGARLQDASVSVLILTAEPPEQARALEQSTGVPTLSIDDTHANSREAIVRTDIGQVLICAPSNIAVDLLDVHLISAIGRRKVLRLPDARPINALGERVLADRSAHPFGPDITLQDIDERVSGGATVEVLDRPPTADDLALAAVSPDGTANLQPGRRTPGHEDTVIAMVGTHDASPRSD